MIDIPRGSEMLAIAWITDWVSTFHVQVPRSANSISYSILSIPIIIVFIVITNQHGWDELNMGLTLFFHKILEKQHGFGQNFVSKNIP